eukprot:226028_1
MDFVFPNQHNQHNQYQNNQFYGANKMYEDEHENEEHLEHQDIPRKQYQLAYEVEYTPNIVRWVKSNYLTHIKGEQHTVLIGGYDHCNKYYLETLIYG